MFNIALLFGGPLGFATVPDLKRVKANDGHDRAKRFSQKVARGNKAVESSSRWQTSSAAYGNF